MIVGAMQRFHVQRDAGIGRKRPKPFLDQLGVEVADLVAAML